MAKATHKGTCQLCGRLQMIKGGVLAAHGYTTRWGFFQGICPGSNEAPYEQSTDAIEGAINVTNKAAANLSQAASKYENTIGATCWMLVKDHQNHNRGWKQGEISGEQTGYLFAYTHHGLSEDVTKTTTLPFTTNETAEKQANELNKMYSASLKKQANEYKEYINWLQERISNWKPEALKPR